MNVDDAPVAMIAKDFGVSGIPQCCLFKSGKVLEKFTGFNSKKAEAFAVTLIEEYKK